MRLIRALVIPWFLYFIVVVSALGVGTVRFPHLKLFVHPLTYVALGVGALLCVMMNSRSLGSVGLWMAESLPDSLRYQSFRWILRAFKAAAIAAVFWFAGQMPWVPLIWQAAVVPAVFTICLFVMVFSLYGPILKWSSNVAWSRAVSLILSLPILAAIPLTAVFLGRTMVFAYHASHSDLAKASALEVPLSSASTLDADEATAAKISQTHPHSAATLQKQTSRSSLPLIPIKDIPVAIKSSKTSERARAFQTLSANPSICSEFSKEISAALDPKGNKDVVYSALKAVPCSDIRTVVGLPKLASLMLEHSDGAVRAEAIRAMKKYGDENIRNIAYLLVKRLGPNEPPDVIEATVSVLAPLGPEQKRWATKRVEDLLNNEDLSEAAAKTLIRYLGRDDLVADYVAANLTTTPEARRRAANMICLLPENKRLVAEPHVNALVATMKTADASDPGLKALDCMGRKGFEAIRQEVSSPKQLQRPVAAKALAELDVKKTVPEAIEIADSCARDSDAQVRKWCSRSLGQIGAPALPKILDLLTSSDRTLKDAGQQALHAFNDPTAKDELQKIVENNSGWMANNRRLQIAKAVGAALAKLEAENFVGADQPTPQNDSRPTLE